MMDFILKIYIFRIFQTMRIVMSRTPNLNLRTKFLGMGTNAESGLAENFRVIDEAIGGEGGGGTPATVQSLTLPAIPGDAGADGIAEGDTVLVALTKLQNQCDALVALNAALTGRIAALEGAG